MFKKLSVLLMALTLVFITVSPSFVDAKGYKAPAKSYNSNSDKTGISKNPSSTNSNTSGTAGAAKTGGLFGGGSFMKGMMIGGLAGMLFGGLFGGMGFMGEILGLMINLLAIFALIFLVMKVVTLFRNRRDQNQSKRPDERRY